MKIAVVILNWDGLKLLKEFLPSVVKYSGNNPIYIIDNNSKDESVDFIKNNYPLIKIIRNERNYGYAKGYNKGLEHVNEDIFCLLNNDVEVTSNWLDPVLQEFNNDKSLSVVQPKILDYKNKNKFEYAGAAGGFIDYYGYPYCRGRIFNTVEDDKGQYDQNIDIFWASGACFFIRKEVFNKLKGFDEHFYNHMEEIDLCWRITNLNSNLKKKFIYKSVVFHLGGGSFDYHNPKKLFYNIRNHRWMIIKNTNVIPGFNFSLFQRLQIIHYISILYAINQLIFLKLIHFKEIIKAIFTNHSYKDGYKILIEQNYMLLRKNNKKPKYYVIKSIIYNYLFLKKTKYSDLNKS